MNELKETINERDRQLQSLTEDNVNVHNINILPRFAEVLLPFLANANDHTELNAKRP